MPCKGKSSKMYKKKYELKMVVVLRCRVEFPTCTKCCALYWPLFETELWRRWITVIGNEEAIAFVSDGFDFVGIILLLHENPLSCICVSLDTRYKGIGLLTSWFSLVFFKGRSTRPAPFRSTNCSVSTLWIRYLPLSRMLGWTLTFGGIVRAAVRIQGIWEVSTQLFILTYHAVRAQDASDSGRT